MSLPFARRFAALGALARREPLLAAISLAAVLYVAAALSPSAYGLVLRSMGVADDGVLLGWPQFIRSDEYAIWTPTLQAAVNSDFGPVNVTSLYAERFRSLSALPLLDWGLPFKPAFWAFFAISPARAFSAYHAFHYWVFLVGWILFLRALGVGRSEAALATLVLFFSGWTQIWWTSLGPVLVYAPFFVLPLLIKMRHLARAAAVFYVTAVWMLDGIFYPPLYVAVSLSALLAILAFRPEALAPARLASWGAGVAAGIGVAAAYHWQALLEVMGSTVHGGRNIGGGGVPWQDLAGTVLPSFSYHGWQVIFSYNNACETSAAGSILWPLILIFALPASFGRWLADRDGRLSLFRAGGLVALALAAALWIVAPVPAIWGKPLLWHLTLPNRLLLLPGLLTLLLALLLLPRLELRWSVLRASLFSALVLGTWLYTEKSVVEHPPGSLLRQIHEHADLALIPLVFALPLFELIRRRWRVRAGAPDAEAADAEAAVAPAAAAGASRLAILAPRILAPQTLSAASLLAAAALANFLFFGPYNPLQSSKAIFARHDTPMLRSLQAMQDAHPQGWLVVGGGAYFGSILNGLGFRSVNHALPRPEVARFGHFFPKLSREQRNGMFNRYLNVQVSPYQPPYWRHPLLEPIQPRDNAVLVPPEPFLPPLDIELLAAPPAAAAPPAPGASTRPIAVGKKWWQIEVIGPVHAIRGDVEIDIHTEPPAAKVLQTWRMPLPTEWEKWGPDMYSKLLIELAAPPGFQPEQGMRYCVTLHDPAAGPRQVGPAGGASTCP